MITVQARRSLRMSGAALALDVAIVRFRSIVNNAGNDRDCPPGYGKSYAMINFRKCVGVLNT